jgi:3'(2'), 5'-bisphosphate nucleotidase
MIPKYYKTLEIQCILDMLILAGDAIMNVYHSHDLGVERKTDQSPVTKADIASNQIIVDFLMEMDDSIPILSEEMAMIDYAERSHWQRCWIIDPLDGTREFITHSQDFCINVALVENQEPTLGFVYLPVKKLCYIGVNGVGAFKIFNHDIAQIRVNTFNTEDPNLRIPVSKSYLDNETTTYIEQHFVSPNLQPCGAGLKFAHVAEGLADIYPRCQGIMEWDVAAGHALIKSAGGNIKNLYTGQELRYNQVSLKLPHFVASGKISKNLD